MKREYCIDHFKRDHTISTIATETFEGNTAERWAQARAWAIGRIAREAPQDAMNIATTIVLERERFAYVNLVWDVAPRGVRYETYEVREKVWISDEEYQRAIDHVTGKADIPASPKEPITIKYKDTQVNLRDIPDFSNDQTIEFKITGITAKPICEEDEDDDEDPEE